MKRILVGVIVAGVLALVGAATERPAAADVGSCYSVQPICMYPSQAVCMCNVSMQCYWACR